ncbi:MAG: DMT family transporter [Anaerotardibacter sp.]
MKHYGTILIIVAGIFWGTMGLFTRFLGGEGFSPLQIAAIRLFLAGIVFLIIMNFASPQQKRIQVKDIPLFLGLGLGSILFFTVCYYTALSMMSLSTAAILLYTSPIWVMLLSALLFKERITSKKLIALGLAFLGCVLTSGFGGSVGLFGLMIGLCSGLGYGLYSILGTYALRIYTPYTVTAYTFIIAGIGGLCICNPLDAFSLIATHSDSLFICGFFVLTALITAVIPFLCYTLGLKTTEASKAAILATIEPIVATLVGITCFGELLTPLSFAGILCVLGAITLLNITLPFKKKQPLQNSL